LLCLSVLVQSMFDDVETCWGMIILPFLEDIWLIEPDFDGEVGISIDWGKVGVATTCVALLTQEKTCTLHIQERST